ncbi:DMT family transporter [Moraxella sp.]|uniref:DMT family transporter n=1 Tax=Moraxella sp. TaxID=479 RepID=UPI0026DD7306|nr:DMT family transporter [Moraxella sp.]MDO4894970.1 DMT family transporter [Moraxella sp.]
MKSFHALSDTKQGYIYTFITMLIWGGFSLFARLTAYWNIAVWDILALRFMTAFLVIIPLLYIKKDYRFLFDYRIPLLTMVGSVGYCFFVYSGFFYAPVAHGVVFLNGTFPLFTAIIAYVLLGQRLDRSTMLSFAIIICTLILMGLMMVNDPAGFGFGDVMFLCSAVFWGLFSVMLRLWKFTPWQIVSGIATYSAIIYLPIYGLFFTPQLHLAKPVQLFTQAIFHGIFVVIIATLTYAKAVEKIGLFKAGSIATLAPFVAAVVAVPLLNEALSPMMLCGLIGMGIGALQPWRWLSKSPIG